MTIASPGQIYLANQRGVAETEGLTRWSTFNYTDYFEESRQPFGSLITLTMRFLPQAVAKFTRLGEVSGQ